MEKGDFVAGPLAASLECCQVMKAAGLFDRLAVRVNKQRGRDGTSPPKAHSLGSVACFDEAAAKEIIVTPDVPAATLQQRKLFALLDAGERLIQGKPIQVSYRELNKCNVVTYSVEFGYKVSNIDKAEVDSYNLQAPRDRPVQAGYLTQNEFNSYKRGGMPTFEVSIEETRRSIDEIDADLTEAEKALTDNPFEHNLEVIAELACISGVALCGKATIATVTTGGLLAPLALECVKEVAVPCSPAYYTH